MKIWLRVEGPEKILRFACARQPLIATPGDRPHPCQSCVIVHRNTAVRQALEGAWREKIPEVLFRYHLLRHEQALREDAARRIGGGSTAPAPFPQASVPPFEEGGVPAPGRLS